MWKFIWVFLLLAGSAYPIGCGHNSDEKGKKSIIKDLVYDQVNITKEITWDKDSAKMVLIPAGYFKMGANNDVPNEKPVHTVEIDNFYMDVNEVSVGQFKKFFKETGYSYDMWDHVALYSPGDEYPMTHLSWKDAVAYAMWTGKRLPTEAEWEYAARGGLAGKRYPWGNDFFQARDYANFHGIDGKDKWWQSSPVGSFKPNGYGLYDMSGNVWEWTSDWYDEKYYRVSPRNNPSGPASGKYRVLRGGSWSYLATDLRVSKRSYHDPSGSSSGGLRCVSSINF